MGYPTMEYEATDARQGRFVVEPLEQGFGHTLGSAISGALLRVLPGAAPVAVTVAGVSSLRDPLGAGDVADLVAMMGELSLTLPEGMDEVTLSLTGSGTVTAGMITAPDGVVVHNPDLVLASMPTGSLSAEILVRSGSGVDDAAPIPTGWFATVARYTPVTRVEYEVGSARVAQRTDFDRLVVDVATDGSVDPEAAVRRASELIIAQFDTLLSDEWREVGPLLPSLGEDIAPVQVTRAEDEVYIEDLGLGARSYNGLRRAGVSTLSDLLALSLAEIKAIPNFGKKSVDEVTTALAERDLQLPPG